MKKFFVGSIAAVSLSVLVATSAAGQVANPLQYAQLKIRSADSVANVNMSAVPAIDRNKVRQVQNALKAKGFDPGPLNGVVGTKTKEAVQNFQDRFGIKATGTIDNQTLFALGVVGDKSAAVEKEQRPQPEPKQPRKKQPSASKKSAKSSERNTYTGARQSSSWCAIYGTGAENCGFTSMQQCRAAVSGVGGSCIPK
jgi:Putative peptidoglycan binding domain